MFPGPGPGLSQQNICFGIYYQLGFRGVTQGLGFKSFQALFFIKLFFKALPDLSRLMTELVVQIEFLAELPEAREAD